MKYNIVKSIFLDFFKKRNHKILPSYPIHSYHDPSLFFINAGMNPFKDIFLGNIQADYKRIANVQKCLRITGKHNDLKNVGYDNYHHTMFEMLGNWSFGDYSREKAITWAWELLINVYNIPKNNVYVSVFYGDQRDQLSFDKETLKYWNFFLDKEHILFFGKKENFWEMGESGPCGPCTEIHIDLRNEKEKKNIHGKYLINKNHPKVIEIWNIVFIEYFRKSNGTLKKLSTKHVDTGMGIERLCMVLQEKTSSYDTDIFSPMIENIQKSLGNFYDHKNFHQQSSIRIVTDHLRSVICSIYDGQSPSNNGAGYIIRKILRRAIIHVYFFLCKKDPFIYHLVNSFIPLIKNFLPNIEQNIGYITNLIKEEEISFLRIIEKGEKKILHIIDNIKKNNNQIIDGKTLFKLHDTYGYPFELSKNIAEKNNISIDEHSFYKELLKQKERAKKNFFKNEKNDWIQIYKYDPFPSHEDSFVGYKQIECDNVFITKYRKIINKKDDAIHHYELVFNRTPFYPKSGGQIGDTGYIQNDFFKKIFIFDTRKEHSVIIHSVKDFPLQFVSHKFKTIVDISRRNNIEINHTSTHLLHFSLKKILGNHIHQKGSYIGDDYIRFDFSHYQKISEEKLIQIENLVQKLIFDHIPFKEEIFSSIEEAKKHIPHYQETFENIYRKKNKIRLVSFGKSNELCIGTHVKNTGDIHIFKILSENSISHGIRRIKAITYKNAMIYLKNICIKYHAFMKNLNSSISPIKEVQNLKKDNKTMKEKIKKMCLYNVKELQKNYEKKSIQFNSINYICDFNIKNETEFEIKVIRKIILNMRENINNLFVIIGVIKNKKLMIFLAISDDIINKKNIHADKIMNKMIPYIKGTCWGTSFFSTAVGNKISGFQFILNDIMMFIKKTFSNNN
ncbi:alanine--tRNA ligase [Blattabacterium cuenoti]|uniref:alanine--tRNA ligase n=1 Tax=Blattabacterium cuenoti TaxID=1653831 RepID=UPI00163CA4FB|nr:alanine--tRNA ligase [Blattabacterium cuenoti]